MGSMSEQMVGLAPADEEIGGGEEEKIVVEDETTGMEYKEVYG